MKKSEDLIFLQDRLKLAVGFHQSKNLESAEAIYKEVLSIEPQNFDALNLMGAISASRCLWDDALIFFSKALDAGGNSFQLHNNRGNVFRELGQFNSALASYDMAIGLNPRYWEAYSNRGVLFRELNQFKSALESFDRAIELNPNYFEAYFNRGNTLRGLNRFVDALASYDKAIGLNPGYVDAHYNRASILFSMERFSFALESYDKVIELNPNHSEAHFNRGNTLREMKRHEEAIKSFKIVLALEPEHKNATYSLASYGLSEAPNSSPIDYVQNLFDEYAPIFSSHLVNQLEYRAPFLLAEQFLQHCKVVKNTMLDLGCGTGLCGESFRGLANNILGVDISQKMLDEAGKKNIYSELIFSEIGSYLSSLNRQFDLIVCADVLIYLGDLDSLFSYIKRALSNNGFFSFTIESSTNDSYQLKATQRYGHALGYIEKLAKREGLTIIEAKNIPIRKENEAQIFGYGILLSHCSTNFGSEGVST